MKSNYQLLYFLLNWNFTSLYMFQEVEIGQVFLSVFLVFQVSWIRHHDLHILTVGGYTYTADMRFRSIYNAPRLYILGLL